jgi:hypothetical protein
MRPAMRHLELPVNADARQPDAFLRLTVHNKVVFTCLAREALSVIA